MRPSTRSSTSSSSWKSPRASRDLSGLPGSGGPPPPCPKSASAPRACPRTMAPVDDFESRYRAVASRDRRFEGRFLVAVTSTGVYCRIGCPSRTPRRDHVRFLPSPAAPRAAGVRACKRCRPDQLAEHDGALVGRALRLIASGLADGAGITGVAGGGGGSAPGPGRRLPPAVG